MGHHLAFLVGLASRFDHNHCDKCYNNNCYYNPPASFSPLRSDEGSAKDVLH